MIALRKAVTVAQEVNVSQLGENAIRTVVVLVAAAVVYLLAVRVGNRFVRHKAEEGEEARTRAETLWVVEKRIIFITIVVTAVLLLFTVWGFSLGPLVAVGTVFGAAIGFGAQDLVKDVIAGFFIVAEDQFRIGDVVTIADKSGAVEDIQLRITVLRDLEGNAHYVPNGQIRVASNFTSLYAQPVVDVGISYDSDVDMALSVLQEELDALAADPEWSERIRGQGEVLGVNSLDDSAVMLRGRLTTVAEERWSVRREALRRIKKRFDAEGITIPFPQLTVHRAD